MRRIKLIWGDKIILESKEEYHQRLKKRHEEIRTRRDNTIDRGGDKK